MSRGEVAELRKKWKFRPERVKLIAACHRSMTVHNSRLFTLLSCQLSGTFHWRHFRLPARARAHTVARPLQHYPLPWGSRSLHLVMFRVTTRRTPVTVVLQMGTSE
jgi:hypothetical protein